MTEKENLGNMMKCPRYNTCSISRCPLDFWAMERVEKEEDKRCINWRYAGVRKNPKMVGTILPSIKELILEIEAKRMAEKGARKG